MERTEFELRHRFISWMKDIDVFGIRLLARLLPRLLLPAPQGPIIMRTLHGFDLWIDPVGDRGVERSIHDSGTYEKGTLEVMGKLLGPGDTFVDVGANIGLMTVFAAREVGREGRVVAFEPNPGTRSILERNIALNDLHNVEVSAFAAGSHTEEAVIFDGAASNRGRATLIRPDATATGHGVQVVRLSDVFGMDRPVHMLKMDIEGYELEALKGMTVFWERAVPPILIIECSSQRENSHGQGTDPIFEYLSALGLYRFFRAPKGKERRSRLVEFRTAQELPEHDNIYCFAPEHVELAANKGLLA